MSIRARLYWLVAIACVGLVGEGLFCQAYMSKMYRTFNYVNGNILSSLLVIDKVSQDITRVRVHTWQHLLLSDPSQKSEMEHKILTIRSNAEIGLSEYEKYISDKMDRLKLANVHRALDDYDNLRAKALAFSRDGKDQQARDLMLNNQAILERIASAIEEHRAYNAQLAEEHAEKVRAMEGDTLAMTALIMLATMLVTGGASAYTARSIIRPLETLQRAVGQVTQTGDFSQRIEALRQDEISLTAQAFNQLLEAQQSAIAQVNEVVVGLSEGDFSRRVSMTLRGDLGVMKEAVNASAQRIQETMDELVGITTALSQGDFGRRPGEGAKGKFKQTIDQATQAMQAMHSMMDDIGQVMQGVAQGDLTHRVRAEGQGDFAKLKANINLSLDTLGKALSAINANTGQVAASAKRSNAAIAQISEGALSQMHAVNQILEAIRQAASAISEISESGETASRKTRDSADAVSDGKGKIERMVALVSGMVSHFEKISKTTEVIQSLAHKTDVLSLNAAIEAARAGDQGSGFAVVADEVGKLAGNSASSAKEISNLIQSSLKEANRALQSVQEVYTDMGLVASSALEVNDMIHRISAALEQQSDAVQSVELNIAELKKATEANALASEQITSLSMELTRIVADTRGEVEKFRI